MIKFIPSTTEDAPQIQQWTDADVYHNGQHSPDWWITGNGLLSFCLCDDAGSVLYIRLDEGEYVRISAQFAPADIVGKRRLVRAILQLLPKLVEVAKSNGSKGLIFSSESPTLIGFMKKAGYQDTGDGDFKLTFGE